MAPTATDQYEEGMRDHDDPETIKIAERKGRRTAVTAVPAPSTVTRWSTVLEVRHPHAGDDRRMTDRIKSMASRWTVAVPVLAVVLLALTWGRTCPEASSSW